MCSKIPQQSRSTQILITKLHHLRQLHAEYGYSQHEFQRYFLINVLKPELSNTDNLVDVGRCLREQLMKIDREERIEEILGVVDLEIWWMEGVGEGETNMEVSDEYEVKLEVEKQSVMKKRKSVRQQKQGKKDKRSKQQKSLKSALPVDNQSIKSNINKKYPTNTNIFTHHLSNIQFYKRILCQSDEQQLCPDLLGNNNGDEKSILQKLLEIKIFSKLLCQDTDIFGVQTTGERLNMCTRIC